MQPLKFSYTAFLFLVIITLINCSKRNETTVDVVVTEKGTSTPAVGIPVNFGYSSTGGVFSSQVVEQTKTTDANGRVSFKGEQKDETFGVGFPNGVDYFGDGTNLDQGKNGTVFLNIYPFAYVRVHAKNVNPFDSNDKLSLSNGLLGGGCVVWGYNRHDCC